MEKKVRDFVYLDADTYVTYDNLHITPWILLILHFWSIFASYMNEAIGIGIAVCIIAIAGILLPYIVRSKHIKKTFRIRFIVSGLFSLYMFLSFAMLLAASFIPNGYTLIYWMFAAVFIFIVFYIFGMVYTVHKGGFSKIKKAISSHKFKKISAIAGMLLPFSGSAGYFVSRILKRQNVYSSTDITCNIVIILFSIVLILNSLGFIHFVKYFYCVKYKINCDEKGKNYTIGLEPQSTPKKKHSKNENSDTK